MHADNLTWELILSHKQIESEKIIHINAVLDVIKYFQGLDLKTKESNVYQSHIPVVIFPVPPIH
jgi:hypothetical protein